MTILNETELKAKNEALFQTGVVGGVTAAKMREYNIDSVESLQSYAGVIAGDSVDNVEVTAAGANWLEYNRNSTSSNQLLSTDYTTGTISVHEPALYFVSIKFNGAWAANEDLILHVHINGTNNPITPIEFAQEGQGTSDPTLISITNVPFIVNSGMITAGGGAADVTLFVSSGTGTFNVNQTTITLSVQYNPLSIRTVG